MAEESGVVHAFSADEAEEDVSTPWDVMYSKPVKYLDKYWSLKQAVYDN